MRLIITSIAAAILMTATSQSIAQTYNLKAGEKLTAVPCEAWKKNSNGSWTLTGQAVYPNNIVISNPTTSAVGDIAELEAKCGKK